MDSTGYADFSCSAAVGGVNSPMQFQTIFDALYPPAVHAPCTHRLFPQLADHLRRELLSIRVLPYKGEEVVNIERTLIFVGHGGFQFIHTALKGMLLGLIVGSHFGETFVGNLAGNLILR